MHEANRLQIQYWLPKIWVVKDGADVLFYFKYNTVLSCTTIDVCGKDAILLMWIMQGHPSDVTEIMYSAIIQCMYHAKDCLKQSRMVKLLLVLPSLILRICLGKRVVTSLTNTLERRMEALYSHSKTEAQ